MVGNSSPAHARYFQERHAPGIQVLTDPSRRVYSELGLKRSVGGTFGPRSLLVGATSVLKGNLQGPVQGDIWQQGGLFVVVPGGDILFEQRNDDAADRPDLDGALARLANWRKKAS